jgi:hypothetical protein
MRNPARIDIFLEHAKIAAIDKAYGTNLSYHLKTFEQGAYFGAYWKSRPDLRFGQAIYNLGYTEADLIYNKEEHEILKAIGIPLRNYYLVGVIADTPEDARVAMEEHKDKLSTYGLTPTDLDVCRKESYRRTSIEKMAMSKRKTLSAYLTWKALEPKIQYIPLKYVSEEHLQFQIDSPNVGEEVKKIFTDELQYRSK